MPNLKTTIIARRAFTLIEILVTIGIILILATLLLAVGSSVHKNSQISATRTELKALEGLADQFERETNQALPPTMYQYVAGTIKTDPGSPPNQPLPSPQFTFVDILYRYPTIKEQLIKMAGDKLKQDPTGHWAILDYFGNPISYLPQNCSSANFPYPVPAVNGWSAITKSYFRSSGPDGQTKWGPGAVNETDAHNNDDILSYEAPR